MDGFKTSKRSDKDEIYKLFSNVMCVRPPKVCVLPDLMQKIFLTWMAPMNMVPCLLLNSVFFFNNFFLIHLQLLLLSFLSDLIVSNNLCCYLECQHCARLSFRLCIENILFTCEMLLHIFLHYCIQD